MRDPLNATIAVENGRIVTHIKTYRKKITKDESSSVFNCPGSAENRN